MGKQSLIGHRRRRKGSSLSFKEDKSAFGAFELLKVAEIGTFGPKKRPELVIVDVTLTAATKEPKPPPYWRQWENDWRGPIAKSFGAKEYSTMARAPRANDDKMPKKRSRKTSPEIENTSHPENGQGIQTAAATVASQVLKQETPAAPIPEEKVRARAYELYLQRGGRDGSPEQDWLQAMEEIRTQHRGL